MTYKAHKAKIELQCDGPQGQGCCARSSFDGRSITEALREARDAGWRLKHTEPDVLTSYCYPSGAKVYLP